MTGDIIVIGNDTYTKVSLLGDKYTKSTSTDSDSEPAAATDPQKIIDELSKFLNTPGVAPTKQADEKCGDKDCYHVSMNLTADQLTASRAALGSAAPNGTGTVDVVGPEERPAPAKVTVAANAGDQGTVDRRRRSCRTTTRRSRSTRRADSDIERRLELILAQPPSTPLRERRRARRRSRAGLVDSRPVARGRG